MKNVITVSLVCFILSIMSCGRHDNQTPPSIDDKPCAPEISANVLDVMMRERLPDSTCKSNKELTCGRKRLTELKLWSYKLSDKCFKDAYIKWIVYYDDKANACADKLSRQEDNDDEKYNEEQRELWRREDAFEVAHPTPRPPRAKPCGLDRSN